MAKARTPTSAPGNKRQSQRAVGGFTLIELLVVLMLVGIATALVSLSLRDPAATRLDQEAARLSALLESGRAESRASGMPVRFELNSLQQGFRFVGLPPKIDLPSNWLSEGVQARIIGASALLLGPEPLIGAQSIELSLEDRRVRLGTNGLTPFKPLDDATP